MATSSSYPTLQDILDAAPGLLATKYLAASALVCALYDHSLTFDDELATIWRDRSITVTKVVYLCVRYGTDVSLVYVAYIFAGFRSSLDDQICKNFAVTLCLFTIIYSSMASTYITFRHYALWDHGKTATIILAVILACTYIPVVVLAINILIVYYHHTIYQPIIRLCLVTKQPRSLVASVWGCMCAFDLLTIALAIVNSFHRPHRQHSDVLRDFKRDGAIFFVSVLLLRFANMLLFITLPPLDEFLGVFLAWAMVSITLSRLILRVEAMKGSRNGINTWKPAVNSFEMGHWSVGSYN